MFKEKSPELVEDAIDQVFKAMNETYACLVGVNYVFDNLFARDMEVAYSVLKEVAFLAEKVEDEYKKKYSKEGESK